jgi:hypothetical protein
VADAGDDQIGLSGRTITLSGARSTPSNRIKSYRWIQIAGPKVMDSSQEKQFFSFTPAAPGVYRFLLLVAADDVVSEPDEVVAMVGELPDSRGVPPSHGSMITFGRSMLGDAGIQGRMLSEQVADVFKAISDRVSLYPSFDYLTSELSRNLDAIIPRDPQSRLVWAQGIFIPLSRTLELELLAVGLDLRWPEAHQRTLTEKQKERLQRVFLTFAQEFRSGSSAR